MNSTHTIEHGDALSILQFMPDNSIDSIVTDPPYGLRFMGKKWDYDVPTTELWAECLRVLKPGGYLLSFAGTRTHHRMAVRIEDAGFEIRDMIAWVYGSGFPKSMNVSKAIDKDGGDGADWNGWGTALKPALEPIVVARKPLIGTVAANVLTHGTGGMNIDGCRVEGGARPSREVAAMREDVQYSGNALAGRVDGSLQSSKAVGETTLGRWPANLIHDGSDEVLAVFPDSNGSGPARTLNRGKRGDDDGWGMADAPGDLRDAGTGSAARFFYCAKAGKKERGEGNNHPTVKPIDLMRYLCRMVTPPGGTVLDPFTGSGSTGKAAVLEGFSFVGIEREKEYVEIAKARVSSAIESTQG